MANSIFDIYDYFPNTEESVPVFTITVRKTDKYVTWNDLLAFDILTERYYGNSLSSYIIKIANPENFDENDIPAGTQIRIPFPLEDVINELVLKINNYKTY